MSKQKLVITGAPGTGKTSVIKHLEEQDYYCYHEIVRDFTKDSKSKTTIESNPIVSVEDPLAFNLKILNGRIAQYKDGLKRKENLLFFDRGIPDVLAYMHYFDQTVDQNFKDACSDHMYNKVFILPPWKDIYVMDSERFESFEQAKDIHHHLEETYSSFGYACISVPFGTVKERVDFILNNI